MERRLFVSALSAMGLVVVAGGGVRVARAQTPDQNDDNQYDGPGYYAELTWTDSNGGVADFFKEGGPFADQSSCQAYMQQQNYSNHADSSGKYYASYSCVYRQSDPKYDALNNPCFLTTACVRHAGLPDDCEELAVMRAFRDGYLRKFEEGRVIVDHYYAVAPGIVAQIDRAPDGRRVLDGVLREVRGTARLIGRGERQAAVARYASMVLTLQKQYNLA